MNDYIQFIQLIKEISTMNNAYLLFALLLIAIAVWRSPEIIRAWIEYKKFSKYKFANIFA